MSLFDKINLFFKLASMSQDDARIILNVSPSASEDEIKKSYRHKIIQVHPDRLMGTDEETKQRAQKESIELNNARDVLLFPERNAPHYKETEQNKDVIADIDDILNRHQRDADAWSADIAVRREWLAYNMDEITADQLTDPGNIEMSKAVEIKRKKYREQQEKAKLRRQEKKKRVI